MLDLQHGAPCQRRDGRECRRRLGPGAQGEGLPRRECIEAHEAAFAASAPVSRSGGLPVNVKKTSSRLGVPREKLLSEMPARDRAPSTSEAWAASATLTAIAVGSVLESASLPSWRLTSASMSPFCAASAS